MGGSSVPSSTAQYQQLATGIWGSPQATKLALPILKPALANIKNQQDMLMGFQKGDPVQTRKFFGLPTDAPSEDIVHAIASRRAGPQIQMPQVQAAQQAQPVKTAAQGGIMSLDNEVQPDPRRRYAAGGAPKALTPQQRQAVMNINKIIAQGGTPTEAQIARLNKIETNTGLNVSPYSDTGTGVPKNPTVAKAVSTAAETYQASPAAQVPAEIQSAATQAGLAPADAYLGQAGSFGTSITKDPVTGQDVFSVTNPYYNQAVNVLQGMNTQPAQFGQATQAYQDAISGLKSSAGYNPQQINSAELQGTAAQMSPYERVASRDVTGASLGSVANINAPTARAESYRAAQMGAPQEIFAKGYDAAQMKASTMQGAQDIAANKLQQYQMDRDRIRNLQAQRAAVAEMTGPETWTSKGVAEKYMNPYVKTALASQQELANIDLKNQLNQIAGQAAGAGAFGGSKTQLALASARRNQDLANRNMASQALSQAYTQGMGQFTTEQQMSQAAKNANQAATNAANLDYVARQYAAEAANQGMDYNTALQNMQAKLGVQQAQQQADLTAAQANQLYGYGGFQSQAQNLASLNAAAQQNMQAINQQRSQYVTQALQAAQANQQAALTTAQQNMIAKNAADQFNAQNATQISQANAQMSLAAQQSNQQTAYNVAAQNAQLQQQANLANQQQGLQAALANQQAGLTTEQQNAQLVQQMALANQAAALTAGQANQQAGLQANQQAIGAYGQAAGAAQGLGSLGTQVGNYNANLANLWGQAGGVLQNLGQGAYGQQQTNATAVWGGPTTLGNQGVTTLGGVGGGQSGVIAQTAKQG